MHGTQEWRPQATCCKTAHSRYPKTRVRAQEGPRQELAIIISNHNAGNGPCLARREFRAATEAGSPGCESQTGNPLRAQSPCLLASGEGIPGLGVRSQERKGRLYD